MVRPAGRATVSMIVSTLVTLATVVAVDASPAGAATDELDAETIPSHAAAIYDYAAATAPCSLPFATLAGVGAVTSDHTRVGEESRLQPDGENAPIILYERLAPTAPSGLLPDTDGGSIDGSADADLTVGPMQFLPATWTKYGTDGNGDGVADPNNLWDAAAAAGLMLCDASVDTDLDGALTAYFGTDDYNEWVGESIAEAAAWQLSAGPAPQRRDVEVITVDRRPSPSAASPEADRAVVGQAVTGEPKPEDALLDEPVPDEPVPGQPVPDEPVPDEAVLDDVLPDEPVLAGVGVVADEADEVQVAGVEQLPAATPTPGFIGPIAPEPTVELPPVVPGDLTVAGDWVGDGTIGSASLVTADDHTVIRRTDSEGRPYGRAIDVTSELDGLDRSGGLVVGEWDGDGIDDLALIVADAEGLVATRFDRAGNVIDVSDLGPTETVAGIVVGPAPVEALSLGGEELWKTVPAHDGTILELWRVGGIIVEASVVDQLSAMLAAAAADGVTLEGWGWRSHEAQIELRRAHCADIWSTPASQCSPPTAVPGTSRHEYGRAVDFHVETRALTADTDEFRWLAAHAEEFGFFNLPSEPWHWSTDGG